tara:strand:+ start:76304 stop:76705 length:402 start_codon:yes stop_codon:yes gene_type:complete
MLNFKGIDHINMNVKNLEESISFYQRIFGFELKESGISAMSESSYAIIGKSNAGMLCLYEKKNLKENDKSHIAHIGFNIKFFDGILSWLIEQGAKIVHYNSSGIIEYPNSKSIYIKDPSGYEIELTSSFAGKL